MAYSKEAEIKGLRNTLHTFFENPESLNGARLPKLPKPETLKARTPKRDKEIAYLKYLIADRILLVDFSYSGSWPEDYISYLDQATELGEKLKSLGMIPSHAHTNPSTPAPRV